MLPGETILSGATPRCPDCELELQFEVCHSAAGYYIGTSCLCGPYSRESDYFPTRAGADQQLKNLKETGTAEGLRW